MIVDQFSFSGHAVIYNPVTSQETISPYVTTVTGDITFDAFGSNLPATSLVITGIANPPQTTYSPVGLALVNSPYAEAGGVNDFDVDGNGLITEETFYQVLYPEGEASPYPLGMGFDLGHLDINLADRGDEYFIAGPVAYATILDSFPQPVPEPRSVAVFVAGILGVGLARQFRRRLYG